MTQEQDKFLSQPEADASLRPKIFTLPEITRLRSRQSISERQIYEHIIGINPENLSFTSGQAVKLIQRLPLTSESNIYTVQPTLPTQVGNELHVVLPLKDVLGRIMSVPTAAELDSQQNVSQEMQMPREDIAFGLILIMEEELHNVEKVGPSIQTVLSMEGLPLFEQFFPILLLNVSRAVHVTRAYKLFIDAYEKAQLPTNVPLFESFRKKVEAEQAEAAALELRKRGYKVDTSEHSAVKPPFEEPGNTERR